MRAGVIGSIAAWLGFTLPSATVLICLGLGITQFDIASNLGLLHGLKLVAAAVIAQAIWAMAKNYCTDLSRICIALASAAIILMVPNSLTQVAVIVASGLIGALIFNTKTTDKQTFIHIPVRRKTGLILLILLTLLLLTLPLIAQKTQSYPINVFANLFQTGSLVFGGGHVVLPLLQSQVVPTAWVDNDTFLAGYGLTQAMPGPLFTFAAYIGAVSSQAPSGWTGGLIALVAIFSPSFLMVIGIMPFWDQLRKNSSIQRSILGVNSAVVGILIAAFYSPVWISTVLNMKDIGFVILFYLLLQKWKLPPWLVVLLGAILGVFI